MRIAILTNAFPPDGKGGAERIAYVQAAGLLERGHEVKVWSPENEEGGAENGKQEEIRDERRLPLTAFRIPAERFPSRFSSLSRMSALRRLFFHLLEDIGEHRDVVNDVIAWKPDVLITHNLTGCGFGTPSAIKAKGVPWLHILHDIQLTEPSGQLRADKVRALPGRFWRSYWAAYRKRAWKSPPDALVSPTLWLLEWHRQYGFRGNLEEILPNPIDRGPERTRSLRTPAALVYVGRLSDDKGYPVFLELGRAFNREAIGSLVVVGDGPLRGAAEMLGDTRFSLKGALSPEDTRREIAQADILIAPSRILENQQTILLEAMAEGTPVVAADVGGTTETLEGSGCPVGNGADIASGILRLLQSPETWRAASIAIRKRAERHDPERYFTALVSLCAGISRS